MYFYITYSFIGKASEGKCQRGENSMLKVFNLSSPSSSREADPALILFLMMVEKCIMEKRLR